MTTLCIVITWLCWKLRSKEPKPSVKAQAETRNATTQTEEGHPDAQAELERLRVALWTERERHYRELMEARSRLDEPRESRVDEVLRAQQALGQLAARTPLPGSTTSSSAAAGVGPRGAVYIAPKFGSKFHVHRHCNGLRSATEVREYEKCRLCG